MKILFYDTETTGFTKGNNYRDEGQPFCLQYAAIQYDTELDRVLQKVSFILNWGDVEISEGAYSVHGITKEVMNSGLETNAGMIPLYSMLKSSERCIGFNMSFDKVVIGSALYRAATNKDEVVDFFYNIPHYDIMKPLTDVCKIPGKRGYKWPKLTEAHSILLGYDFDDAHDALADIEATFRLWQYCNENNIKPILV